MKLNITKKDNRYLTFIGVAIYRYNYQEIYCEDEYSPCFTSTTWDEDACDVYKDVCTGELVAYDGDLRVTDWGYLMPYYSNNHASKRGKKSNSYNKKRLRITRALKEDEELPF